MNALILAVLLGRADQTAQLEAEVRRRPTAAAVRALADAYVVSGRLGDASAMYVRTSEMYGKLGDPNAAKIFADLANRYRSTVTFCVDRPVDRSSDAVLAKYEPAAGCYLGANIEREDATRYPQSFNNLIGKHHALFFMYRKYGVDFPREYAAELRKARCGLQLAFEPTDLDQVRNDEYLQKFAEEARQSGIPIFLRYASEMNGDWTPYHRDPRLYVEKFRLVASVMHDLAPNVAMVWCPNEIPEGPIPDYFPGDDAVDWVGVNFYSVIFNDADRSKGAEWRHPEDALDYVYRHYSARHPIMVGEWAATHRSTVDNLERPDFAATKIAQFYAALPALYPRVKAVSWLSFNSFKYASAGRQLNDYSLFDNDAVAQSYTQAVSKPYFLDTVSGDAPLSVPTAISPGAQIARGSALTAYVRTYEAAPSATFTLGKKVLGQFRKAGSCEFSVPDDAPLGSQSLTAEVRDSAGRLAGRCSISVTVTGG